MKPDFSAPTFTFAICELSSVVGVGFIAKPNAEMAATTTMVMINSFFMIIRI